MDTVTAEKLAAEFVRILGEGWKPDLDEFLGRVPEQHREECRRHIEQLAQRSGVYIPARASEPEPAALPVGQAHDEEGLEWIERHVSATGADAVPFSIVAQADPQAAVAVAEAHVGVSAADELRMEAPGDRRSEVAHPQSRPG